ncbi:hypothetical protein ACLOJK_023417 [Asimina triloba]
MAGIESSRSTARVLPTRMRSHQRQRCCCNGFLAINGTSSELERIGEGHGSVRRAAMGMPALDGFSGAAGLQRQRRFVRRSWRRWVSIGGAEKIQTRSDLRRK